MNISENVHKIYLQNLSKYSMYPVLWTKIMPMGIFKCIQEVLRFILKLT